ncbi:MAG: A-macroglobulin complement component, partial [Planctomycetes bacterium]|nr:A-macroglobulin complement component [Planctomycetota bacterium]
MFGNRPLRNTLALLSLLTAAGLLWQITLAKDPEADPPEKGVARMASTETMGGADRYRTHLSTDKPIYRPGETLYVRGVLLHHSTRVPLAENAQFQALVEIHGPKGDTVASGFVASQQSVLGYSWAIPEGQAGGEYTIKVSYPGPGHPPAERKFDIRAYRAPRLKSQIEFLRDGYGPGDEVAATLEVERAEGGVPVGAKVTVTARVDGTEVYRGTDRVDQWGNCPAQFTLPEAIERGEGTLAMVIEDGGIVETASKTIPILLQTVDLTAYPEGGDLVAGLPNRVYFEAFTPAKKPADMTGVVVDDRGRQVAEFRSEHEGRGRFEFIPRPSRKYSLKITKPAGIEKLFPLPEVKPEGVVIRSESTVFEPGQPVTLSVGCIPFRGDVQVTLCQGETEVAAARPNFKGAEFLPLAPATLNLPEEIGGVLVATVWSGDGKPLAERLIFRRPAESVYVKITPDAPRYVPGGTAKLTIETTDASGEPVAAVVGLTVTDDTVQEMIETREQAPRLPVMVLLENDVRELADAHVYLDPENPDAPEAVDLLLGTQGWRRFALVDPAKFIAQHGDGARRALALRMVSRREREEVWRATGGALMLDGMALPGGEAPMPMEGAAPEDPVAGDAPDAVAEPAGEPAEVHAADPADAPVAEPGPPPPVEPPPADPAAGPAAMGEDLEMELPAAQAMPVIKAELSQERRQLNKALEEVGAREKRDALFDMDRLERIRNDFVAVRIYAHQVRPNRQPGQRSDFAETLFWHAGIATDEKTGRATVEFGLNDSVTSFRVAADAFTMAGALGEATEQIESVEPYYIEPKLPLEVTSGDQILLPIGIVNATDSVLSNASIAIEAHPSLVTVSAMSAQTLTPDARVRRLLPVGVESYNGDAELTLSGTAGPYADRVTRTIAIRPSGFPIEAGFGGLLASGGAVSHEIEIPESLVADSMTSRAVVYPTPLANLNEALARLIREPCGCFEQTSSSTYPLVMAQQYFTSHTGVDPAMVERSDELLSRGYDRLAGFECEGDGYEWFGADPGHEALTAYGLLEFSDMAQVRHVDDAMLQRTRKWLLDTRDGKGGFTRERRALHTWIADPACSNAYIVWALLQSGETVDLTREIAGVRDAAEKSENTYAVALSANVLALAGDAEGANRLLDRLAGKQADDGSLEGATTSIVGSGGQALMVETTALATMAWLRNPRYAAQVEKSMRYLAEACKAGRYGSTQSTVLALKAIVEYDRARAKPKAPGNLQLVVDGRFVGAAVQFDSQTEGA